MAMFDLLFPKWWSTLKKLIWLKAAALSSAVVKTVTAAIVHIKDALAGPAQNVTIAIEPVQDLNGYDSPWPAGGGPNFYDGTYTAANKQFLAAGTGVVSYYEGLVNRSIVVPCKAGEKYVIRSGIEGTMRVGSFPAMPATGNTPSVFVTATATSGQTELTITTGASDAYLFVQFFIDNDISDYGASLSSALNRFYYSLDSNVCPIAGRAGTKVYNDPAHGGLIRWNQTVYDVEATGGTKTISDGIVSVHPTGSANRLMAKSTATIAGHKYFEAVTIKSDGEHRVGFQNYLFPGTLKTASASWTVLEDIQTAASTGNPYVQLYSVSNTDYQIKQGSFMFFDLTEMFGAGKEPATVQEFRALFPKESYAYNEGEPMTVSAVNGDPYTLIPISWEEEAGTVYGGTLDVTTGELTVDAVSATVNPADIAQSVSIYYVGTNSLPMKVGNGLPGICDRFPTVATSDHFGVRFGANNSIIYFYKLENLGIGTIEEARAWFTANPTTVVYPLATPVTCQLTPQEVQLLAGENNIWADTGNTTLTYLADGRASDTEALNILLGGAYRNSGAADEATDAEALEILLGGNR